MMFNMRDYFLNENAVWNISSIYYRPQAGDPVILIEIWRHRRCHSLAIFELQVTQNIDNNYLPWLTRRENRHTTANT
jgi:hypothetical protein